MPSLVCSALLGAALRSARRVLHVAGLVGLGLGLGFGVILFTTSGPTTEDMYIIFMDGNLDLT